MMRTVLPRRQLVAEARSPVPRPDASCVKYLQDVHTAILGIPGAPEAAVVELNGKQVTLRISPVLWELKKDILFLTHGDDAVLDAMAERYSGFREQVDQATERALAFLGGRKKFVHGFFDRDGTTNQYIDLYSTSAQGVHNAVNQARAPVDNPVQLTSAPLNSGGLKEISALPVNWILNGSTGRELEVPSLGQRFQLGVEREAQRLLQDLNQAILRKLQEPDFELFGYIGSAFQEKCGQTTMARQDKVGSIDEARSIMLRQWLLEEVQKRDPTVALLPGKNLDDTGKLEEFAKGDWFTLNDTGTDIEIIANNEAGETYTKADGVEHAAKTMGWDLSLGPNIVAGNTSSDIPMIEALYKRCSETLVLFVSPPVTERQLEKREKLEASRAALRAKVIKACPNTLFLDSPDHLIAFLLKLSRALSQTP
jgi:hypothetical protein